MNEVLLINYFVAILFQVPKLLQYSSLTYQAALPSLSPVERRSDPTSIARPSFLIAAAHGIKSRLVSPPRQPDPESHVTRSLPPSLPTRARARRGGIWAWAWERIRRAFCKNCSRTAKLVWQIWYQTCLCVFPKSA